MRHTGGRSGKKQMMKLQRSHKNAKLQRSKSVVPRRTQKSVLKRVTKSQRRCKQLLAENISAMMDEYKHGRWVSRSQALAVAYSKTRKDCKVI